MSYQMVGSYGMETVRNEFKAHITSKIGKAALLELWLMWVDSRQREITLTRGNQTAHSNKRSSRLY
jgi:hypothetical protein